MYICMCCVNQLVIETKYFIHVDILVLVSEFVVVAIFSEWWSVPTTANHCGHISVLGAGISVDSAPVLQAL